MVPDAPPEDAVEEGIQFVRILYENSDNNKTPSGKYFVIVVHDIRIESFGSLTKNSDFISKTPEKEATAWSEMMRRVYSSKRNARGDLAFPNGVTDETFFTVYSFTPIMSTTAQDFLLAQYLYYKRELPPHIHTDWMLHYGSVVIENIKRRSAK